MKIKPLLKSFIYDLVETLCFPDKKVKEIFKKYGIKRVEIFHVLTDTDSISLKLMSISDPKSDRPEEKYCDIIFEVIIAPKIYKRFDTSHEFWDIFGARKKQERKN